MAKHKQSLSRIVAVFLAALLTGCAARPASSVSVPVLTPASSAPPQSQSAPQPPAMPVLQPLPLATNINALTGLPRPEGMPEGQRPVALSIPNNIQALPQAGVAQADVVVEMLTEGGITRLLAMYADYRALPLVGPVRSTRDQFVQFAMPTNSILAHIGTSVYARNLLQVAGYASVDGLYLGTTSFWFDDERTKPRPGGKLAEYCWFTSAELFQAGLDANQINPVGEVRTLFNFTTDAIPMDAQAASISVAYSDADQAQAGFAYNTEDGLYHKSIAGAPHTDMDGAPLAYHNVFLLWCDITLKPDGQCTEFDFSGGEGCYFTQGGVKALVWRKGGPEDALRLFTPQGEELPVMPGKSYVGFVPNNREDAVAYS